MAVATAMERVDGVCGDWRLEIVASREAIWDWRAAMRSAADIVEFAWCGRCRVGEYRAWGLRKRKRWMIDIVGKAN